MKEKWILLNHRGINYNELGQELRISPLNIKIAMNRGVKTKKDLFTYFYGTVRDMHDPREMKDCEKAARILLRNINEKKKIAIASDFDVDGIFSGLILYKLITRLGGVATIYTPDRIAEGYGVNRRIIDQCLENGVSMLITCDNGIAATDTIQYAIDHGLEVVVTDHHEVPYVEENGVRRYIIPPAHAVVNPKQADCRYPYKGLCGAGVTYKLGQLLYDLCGLPTEELKELLSYAAIATVADVMDLTGENRIIVKWGLDNLRNVPNIGVQALIDVCGLDNQHISSYHIGFVLGPCFNATGRLSSVKRAFALLLSKNPESAMQHALDLKQLNDQRKDMTLEGVERAEAIIAENHLDQDDVMVIYVPQCHESLVGIIAGRIREHYHKPVFVITDAESGLKGSGRSIEQYSMFERLQDAKEYLTRFGGHPMAAGISLERENLENLRKVLNEHSGLKPEDFVPIVKIDAAAPLSYLTEEVIEDLELLEPFGKGNQKPLFAGQHFTVKSLRIIGKNNNVVKMKVEGSDCCERDAMIFQDADIFVDYLKSAYGEQTVEDAFAGYVDDSHPIDMGFVFYPGINEYKGNKTLQIVIQNYEKIG